MSIILSEANMSPDESPGEMPKTGVRKVNNLPVYILGAAITIFLVVMMLVAWDRAEKQNRPIEAAKEEGGNSTAFVNQIAGDYQNGIIPAKENPLIAPTEPTLTSPSVAAPALTIVRPDNMDKPPLPPSQANGNLQPKGNEEEISIRQMKFQQFQEAIKAKTTVLINAARSPGSPPDQTQMSQRDQIMAKIIEARQQMDATISYKNKIAQLKDTESLTGAGTEAFPPKDSSNTSNNELNQFDTNGQVNRWKIETKPEAPTTPYELRAGFVIPGTLISGINSELPGQIMAQVAQDIFDTPTGKYTLIPQGSRLVGTYSSDLVYGQARVLVAWQRIIFPDGKAMDIGAMPGADSAGYAGFNDQVNNHYLRLFGSALLMSAITAGASYSQQQNQQNNGAYGAYGSPNANSVLSQALGQQLGQVTSQLINKNMNIAPTLEIRPGYRFNVIVTKDLTLSKPYRAFDY